MLTLATKFVPNRPSFETACAAGFQAAEFWLDAGLLAQADDIAALAGNYANRYALHFPNHGAITAEALCSTVDLYHQVRGTATVIHQPMFDRYGAALKKLAPDLDLAIENHVLDPDEFERWADRSPGLTLDVEHLWKFTLLDAPLEQLLDHVEQFLRRYAGKLHHVHLPGYQPGGEEHHPIHHNEVMATQVMTRLTEHGYTKLVVSESDAPFQTLECLQQDILLFKRWANSMTATA